ncbi:hypothetical protein PILCRDRAFT_823438 [Piloderma croceum F 1598]|uniref:Uncharacterized protein n=1 Tax=Piloderma croceum (strain F 1598) TaxID=765440 RepID=A0A0C3AZV8_PILCF|nr:hypothetical protein PILCRDRAFT_823438 [Piloderma croceum F 1598]
MRSAIDRGRKRADTGTAAQMRVVVRNCYFLWSCAAKTSVAHSPKQNVCNIDVSTRCVGPASAKPWAEPIQAIQLVCPRCSASLSTRRLLCVTVRPILWRNWPMACRYISTNSSVTGHSDPRREDLGDLSQVTMAIEEMDRNFQRLAAHHLLAPKNLLKR